MNDTLKARLLELADTLQNIASADLSRSQLDADCAFAAGLYRGSSNACALAACWIREEIYTSDPDQEVSDDA